MAMHMVSAAARRIFIAISIISDGTERLGIA
jgi:hypothetical protein